MAYGTLRVHVTVASSALPLEGASVTAGNITKITNENGIVLFENIEAPDASLSLDPSNTQLPYSVLDIEVRKENYQTITVRNAQGQYLPHFVHSFFLQEANPYSIRQPDPQKSVHFLL